MSLLPHRCQRAGCPCCVVYGPRQPTSSEAVAKARREAAEMLASPEVQAMLAELRLIEGKRQLGQALSELFGGAQC